MNNDKELLIRYEYFGPLLYSTKIKNYLIPKETLSNDLLDVIIKKRSEGKDWTEGVSEEIVDELKAIGIDGQIRVLNSKYNDRLMAPLEYYFDYTTKCNLRCEHCYNKEYIGNVTMPKEKVSKIIKEMHKMGVMRLHLAGGEPTIDKEGLKNYLETAKSYGIVTSIATNGLLLDDEVCEILTSNNLISVSISLDGPNEEINKGYRGEGAFQKIISGIKKLQEYRDRSKEPNMEVCIKPIYSPSTENYVIEELIKLAIDLKVDKIKFSNPERSLNHDQGHYGKDAELYYEKTLYIKELQQKYKDQIHILNISNPVIQCIDVGLPNMKGCIGGQELITINPDGRITPCLMNNYNLGNINDWENMSEFYEKSEKLKAYRKIIVNDECTNCSLYKNCRGGCQVRKIVQYKTIQEKDPLCPKKYLDDTKQQKAEYIKEKFNNFKIICVAHSL